MDFEQADHGVNITGMQTYIDDLNTVVLVDAAQALRDTNGIKEAVRAGWHGNAPEQFIANIDTAKEKMVETLKALRDAFEKELKGIQSEIIDMDANLVEEEK